ncbi:MAG: prolyl oligopeptidase family serine peptidase [Planctomycetota bacterium]
MDERFARLPRSLQDRATTLTLGDGVPALVALPEGDDPVPFVLWMHGRTVNKELDPGRYLRWIRAGIAAVAVDLPGHGDRFIEGSHDPERTPAVVEQMYGEIDGVLASIRDRHPRLDMTRAGIGGMSAGGMATLRRLCDPHPFLAASIEGTTGDLIGLYFPDSSDASGHWPVQHDRAAVKRIDSSTNLSEFEPLPLLALHNEGDELVPISLQRRFLERLGEQYAARGANRDLITLWTFADTGAPMEHAGFGRFGNDAKNVQLDFLSGVLLNGRT